MRTSLARVAVGAGVTLIGGAIAVSLAPAAHAAGATLTGTPTTGLSDGSAVTVSGTGFIPGKSVFVLECSSAPALGDPAGQAKCAISTVKILTASPAGAVATTLTVHTGAIGNGTCEPGSTCYIIASDQTNLAVIPISFAGGTSPTTTPPTTTTPTTTATATATATAPTPTPTPTTPPASVAPTASESLTVSVLPTSTSVEPTTTSGTPDPGAPTSVAAGSGGGADRTGPNEALMALVAVGGAATVGGTIALARHRKH